MSKITHCIYPRIAWKEGEKKLWNPIHRKALKNLPEERVRLQTIEYLLYAGWSKHRISTEEAVEGLAKNNLRTDIICYDRQFTPRLLVECKAGHISISERTAEQAARYNQRVGAPYLLLTNGITDYWYTIERTAVKELDAPPKDLALDFQRDDYHFSDWKVRGFAGEKAPPKLRKWVEQIYPALWLVAGNDTIRYLNFKPTPTDVSLDHYYRVRSVAPSRRIAFTTLSTAYGGTRLIGILNEQGKNRAVAEINIGLFFEGKEGNSTIYSQAGSQTFSLKQYWDLQESSTADHFFDRLNRLFIDFLD